MEVSDELRAFVRKHAAKHTAAEIAQATGASEAEVLNLARTERVKLAAKSSGLPTPSFQCQASFSGSPLVVNRDALLCLVAAAVAFVAYSLTLARDVTAGPGDALAAAAATLGVAPPPGFPLYSILGKAFSWIPIESAAFRVGLLSAVAAAGAVGLTVHLLLRLTGSRPAALAAGLLFAFSSGLWSEAVVPSAAPLNALLAACSLLAAWRWTLTRRRRDLAILGLLLGLGIANHAAMAPLAGCFLLYVFMVHRNIWREPGTLPLAVFAVLAPLLLYAWLPARAETGPFVNWGNPATADAFLDHVLERAGSSAENGADEPGPGRRFLTVARAASRQVTPFLGWLALPGAFLAFRRDWRLGVLLLCVFVAPVVAVSLKSPGPLGENFSLLLPSWLIGAVWVGLTLSRVAGWFAELRPRPARVAAWVFPALAVVPFALHARALDRSGDLQVRDAALAILESLPKNALLVPSGSHVSLPLIYLQGVESRRRDVTVVTRYGSTDPALLEKMPAYLRIGVGRFPSPAAERKFQTWLFEHTERPVFLMHWRPLDDLPGWRLVPEGPVLRLVKPGGRPPAPRESGDAFADLALSSAHRDEAAARITGDLLVAQGTRRAMAKDLDGARAAFAEAERAYVAYPDGLAHLAAACLEAGLLAEARGHAEAALVLAPRSRAALRTLVTVLTRQKRWAEAKAAIDRLIALDPKDTAACLVLVQFHRDQGNRRLAIFELEKLSKEQPREPRWLVMAGDLSLEERDSLSALTYYQRALAIAPERADLLDKVQAILTGEGRPGFGDPFAPGRPGGAFDIPGAPRDPLEGLFPPRVPGDPRDPSRRR